MTPPNTAPNESFNPPQESSTLSTAFNILVSTALLLNYPLAASLPTPTIPDSMPPPSLIACLESYINPALPIGTGVGADTNVPALHLLPSTTLSKLKNVGPARIKDMRVLGHAKQILSHVPVAATPATCTRFNDTLASVVQINRDKFAALAVLPMEGREAAKELQRCVVKLKFVGGVLGLKPDERGGLTLGNDLEEVWSVAARYRVPVMVRDMWPLGTHVSLVSYSWAASSEADGWDLASGIPGGTGRQRRRSVGDEPVYLAQSLASSGSASVPFGCL